MVVASEVGVMDLNRERLRKRTSAPGKITDD